MRPARRCPHSLKDKCQTVLCSGASEVFEDFKTFISEQELKKSMRPIHWIRMKRMDGQAALSFFTGELAVI